MSIIKQLKAVNVLLFNCFMLFCF